MALPFLRVLRPPVCSVSLRSPVLLLVSREEKGRRGERDIVKRNKAEDLEVRGLFVSFTILISLPTGISSTVNDVSHF